MRVPLSLVIAVAAGPTVAAPLPRDNRPVISPETVGRLKPVGEVGRDAWRVVFGPGPAETTLLSWAEPPALINGDSLKPVGKAVTDKIVIHMAVARVGERVAWCENDTRITVLDLKAGKMLTIETGMAQPQMEFSPDGKLLATGGSGTEAKLWEADTGKLVRSVDAGGTGGIHPVFSPNGAVLAVGNRNQTTRLYEVKTGILLRTLDRSQTQGLKFSPDGKLLAVGYVNGTVGIWDVGAGRLLRAVHARVEEVYEVDWTPKGDVLVTAGREGKIVLWDPTELKLLRELESPEWVIQARFSSDGRRLWTAGGGQAAGPDRKVVVWGLPDR